MQAYYCFEYGPTIFIDICVISFIPLFFTPRAESAIGKFAGLSTESGVYINVNPFVGLMICNCTVSKISSSVEKWRQKHI